MPSPELPDDSSAGKRRRAEAPPADFAEVLAAERAAIDEARRRSGIPPEAPLWGLAFSGGGIRSATFNLGVLQALSHRQPAVALRLPLVGLGRRLHRRLARRPLPPLRRRPGGGGGARRRPHRPRRRDRRPRSRHLAPRLQQLPHPAPGPALRRQLGGDRHLSAQPAPEPDGAGLLPRPRPPPAALALPGVRPTPHLAAQQLRRRAGSRRPGPPLRRSEPGGLRQPGPAGVELQPVDPALRHPAALDRRLAPRLLVRGATRFRAPAGLGLGRLDGAPLLCGLGGRLRRRPLAHPGRHQGGAVGGPLLARDPPLGGPGRLPGRRLPRPASTRLLDYLRNSLFPFVIGQSAGISKTAGGGGALGVARGRSAPGGGRRDPHGRPPSGFDRPLARRLDPRVVGPPRRLAPHRQPLFLDSALGRRPLRAVPGRPGRPLDQDLPHLGVAALDPRRHPRRQEPADRGPGGRPAPGMAGALLGLHFHRRLRRPLEPRPPRRSLPDRQAPTRGLGPPRLPSRGQRLPLPGPQRTRAPGRTTSSSSPPPAPCRSSAWPRRCSRRCSSSSPGGSTSTSSR